MTHNVVVSSSLKTNITASNTRHAYNEIIGKIAKLGLNTDKPKELNETELRFYKGTVDTHFEGIHTILKHIHKQDAEKKDIKEYCELTVPQCFCLQECLDKWYKEGNNFLFVSRKNDVTHFFKRWQVKYESKFSFEDCCS